MNSLGFSINPPDPFVPEEIAGIEIEKDCKHKDSILLILSEFNKSDDKNHNNVLNDYRQICFYNGKIEISVFSEFLLERIKAFHQKLS